MYCKEKIYAGTEEFSFEELRAARIFAKIRVGTYQPPDAGTQPENVRYMYPKKEVYSFDGEFQYEEILAQRYLARQNRQGPPTNQVPQGCQMPTENLVPEDNQIPTCTRKFLNDDEPCPMEIGSCVKSLASATRPAGIDDGSFQATSASHGRYKCLNNNFNVKFKLEVSIRAAVALESCLCKSLLACFLYWDIVVNSHF